MVDAVINFYADLKACPAVYGLLFCSAGALNPQHYRWYAAI